MAVIYPDDLSVSAVFPQCVDNQYVSPQVFNQIISDSSLNFNSDIIQKQRLSDVNSELIRSLLYSSEVVLNRAFMINNNLLYKLYHPKSEKYSDGFIELVNQGVIIPFLFKYYEEGEQMSTEDFVGSFQTANQGIEACEHLFDRCGTNLTTLALAHSKDDLDEKLTKISLGFESRLDDCYQTASTHPALGSKMFAQIYPNAFLDENNEEMAYDAASDIFLTSLFEANAIPRFNKFNRSPKNKITPANRNQVYQSFLITDCKCGKGLDHPQCECITNGCYDTHLDPIQRQAIFGGKAMVDLVYSTVVPDLLHRFVFTPRDLPTRKALQDLSAPETMGRSKVDDVAKAAQDIARSFHATANEAFVLPDLGSFSFEDAINIRGFQEWRNFINLQNEILNDPIDSVNKFDDFQDSFSELQNAISKYFTEQMLKNQDIKATKYYCFVSGAITIAGDVIRIGMGAFLMHKGVSPVSTLIIDRVIERILGIKKDQIPVGPAQLMFEFMDVDSRKVKKSMSWSVDWMSKQVEWEKKDLLEFLKENKKKNTEAIVPSFGISNIGEC